MFGHNYAVVLEEGRAHYGVVLFGREESTLAKAWSAMKNAIREVPPLTHRFDFPDQA